MKKIDTLVLTIILVCFTLFSFTGCEDKKAQDSLIAVENTTEIFTQNDKDQQKEKQEISNEQSIQEALERLETQKEPKQPIDEKSPASQTATDTFTLRDIQQTTHTLSIKNQKIIFQDIDQSIVLINFFSTWSSPSRAEIPYLSDLQKKHNKDLFVAGVLINDVIYDDTLKEFISKHHANYFISNSKQNDAFAAKVAKELQLPENFSIPLTVIYKDGNYYTHYEGAVPVEMIDHDIQEAMKTKGL